MGPGIRVAHFIEQILNHGLEQVVSVDDLGAFFFVFEETVEFIQVEGFEGELTGIKRGIIDVNFIIGFELLDELGLALKSVHQVLDEI